MEKRQCKRRPVHLGCWLVGSDEALCCGAFEISETGVSIKCSAPPVPGKCVRLQFFTPLSAGALTLEAEVVWSTLEPEGAMGLRFRDMDAKALNILKELMRQQRQKLP